MEDAVIMEKLKTALRQMFGIPQEILSQLSSDTWLCGSPIYLNSVNMVYLFFELEHQFGVSLSIKEDEYLNFSTINGIAETIENTLLKTTQKTG